MPNKKLRNVHKLRLLLVRGAFRIANGQPKVFSHILVRLTSILKVCFMEKVSKLLRLTNMLGGKNESRDFAFYGCLFGAPVCSLSYTRRARDILPVNHEQSARHCKLFRHSEETSILRYECVLFCFLHSLRNSAN